MNLYKKNLSFVLGSVKDMRCKYSSWQKDLSISALTHSQETKLILKLDFHLLESIIFFQCIRHFWITYTVSFLYYDQWVSRQSFTKICLGGVRNVFLPLIFITVGLIFSSLFSVYLYVVLFHLSGQVSTLELSTIWHRIRSVHWANFTGNLIRIKQDLSRNA